MKKAIVVLLVGIAGGLLGAELAIRAFDLFADARAVARRAPPPEEADRRGELANVVHPYLGWSRRPGRLSPLAVWAGRIPIFPGEPTEWAQRQWRANTFGYFSEIPDYTEVGRERYAVGVFGGSVADELAVLGGAALDAALAERFPRLRGSIAILNLGSSGYKQPQQLISLLEMALAGVPFDLIVNLDGYNELYFGYAAAQDGHHPVLPSPGLYRTTVGFLMQRTAEQDELAARVQRAKAAERAWLARVGPDSWLGRSELARALGGALAERHARRGLGLESELQQRGAATPELPVASFPHRCDAAAGGCWSVMADVWERSSLAMHAIARRIGAEYVHVLQPNQYVRGTKPLSAEERRYAWKTGLRVSVVRRGYATLRERGARLRAAGVPFHDLTDIYADSSETLYRDVCCHLNLRGNELLAREIAAKVVGPP